jgi:hypothetical protein
MYRADGNDASLRRNAMKRIARPVSMKSGHQPEVFVDDDNVVETTLGDLIVALTDETTQQVKDEKVAYILVAYILSDLLRGGEPISTRWH